MRLKRLSLSVLLACSLASAIAVGPAAAKSRHKAKPKPVTVATVLTRLEQRHTITVAQKNTYTHQWHVALSEEQKLHGARRSRLTDVVNLMNQIARSGAFTRARLPVLFLTLARNVQWWPHGRLLVYGDRVEFPGSQIVWQYYPGAGLQLQVLGTFGNADGFYESGRQNWPKLLELLGEMRAVAVPRAGGTAWEYYFNWEGGAPPWVSAMAQATGLIAMTNGYLASGDKSYLTTAHRMLPLLEQAPPAGTAVRTKLGLRFLQYSFTPKTDIINAFLQTLIGLDYYYQVSHDPTALSLFNRGNAQAKAELPQFVVGGWSLYDPNEVDPLSYHELVTGFAQSLCKLTAAPVYCNTATAFQTDLTSKPVLKQITTSVRSGHSIKLQFKVSKLANVGVVMTRNGRRYLYTKALVHAGESSFKTSKLPAGTYQVRIAATDMAGNYTAITGSLQAHR
jgi:hypothetical protein